MPAVKDLFGRTVGRLLGLPPHTTDYKVQRRVRPQQLIAAIVDLQPIEDREIDRQVHAPVARLTHGVFDVRLGELAIPRRIFLHHHTYNYIDEQSRAMSILVSAAGGSAVHIFACEIMRDQFVGRALAALHGSPTRDWTLESLAREVGLSRSALAERFTEFV